MPMKINTTTSGKKLLTLFLILLAVLLCAFPANAKPSKKTVKKAFKKYIRRYKDATSFGPQKYYLTDLNKDGVKECIVQFQDGMKCRLIILVYKNNKVRKAFNKTGVEEIHYNKSKNRICIDFSSGAADHDTIIYKLSGKKMKKKDYYKSVSSYSGGSLSVTHYHKKQIISESAFYAKLREISDSWRNVSPFAVGKEIP